MEEILGLSVLLFEDQNQWHDWLAKNYAQTEGVWLKFAKKASGQTSVAYKEALDEALCYGWIDTQVRKYDDSYYLQKFTPRRPNSVWSKVNVDKVARLTSEGKMQPSGLAAIEQAKQNGRWEQAYDSFSKMEVPADFQVALDAKPKAKAFYETLNRTNTYAILWRIQTAKKPETRKNRIEKLISMLENGEKLH
jgi:uncharacterized protein YdeI (YjbR/CyaY-like superfamily)